MKSHPGSSHIIFLLSDELIRTQVLIFSLTHNKQAILVQRKDGAVMQWLVIYDNCVHTAASLSNEFSLQSQKPLAEQHRDKRLELLTQHHFQSAMRFYSIIVEQESNK